MKNKIFLLTIILVITGLLVSLQNSSLSPSVVQTKNFNDRVVGIKAASRTKFLQIQTRAAEIDPSEDYQELINSGSYIQTSVDPSTLAPVQTFRSDQSLVDESLVVSQANVEIFPSIESFAADVRARGLNGLWAEGFFAYRVYNTEWGVVPDSFNTASFAGYEGYQGYFIHNYLGGTRLYEVEAGTPIAVITADRIDWYEVDGIHRFAGTSTGNGCEYTAPFYDWNGEGSYSAMDLISAYYTQPFAIQTCLCTGDKNGILILTGSPQ